MQRPNEAEEPVLFGCLGKSFPGRLKSKGKGAWGQNVLGRFQEQQGGQCGWR